MTEWIRVRSPAFKRKTQFKRFQWEKARDRSPFRYMEINMKKREEKSLSVSHSRRAFLVWVPASLLVTACGGDNGSSAPASIKKAVAALTGPGGATWTGMGKGGILIQSPYSGAGNFELLAGDEYGMLHCLRRTNDNGAQWMVAVGDGMGSKNSVSGYCHTYSTNYTNIEAAVVDDGAVKTYFRSNSTPWSAHKTISIGDAQGFPAYLQSNRNGAQQLELVVGMRRGGMVHYWRDDKDGFTWKQSSIFGSGQVKGVSVMQGNYIGPDNNANLELVAWVDDRLESWCCEGRAWRKICNIATGGIAHYWRNNDAEGIPWSFTGTIGTGAYVAAGLLQSQNGVKGDFEAIGLRASGKADVFRRGDTLVWENSATVSPFSEGTAADVGVSSHIVDVNVTGINSVLLKNGSVLMFGYYKGGSTNKTIPACIWNPVNDQITAIPSFRNNFCAGQTAMPDGKVLIVGGHIGDTLKDVVVFDPDNHTATLVATMTKGRWYPSTATLPDGQVFIISGTETAGWNTSVNDTWQTYANNALTAPEDVISPFSPYYPKSQTQIDLYPFLFVLPDGKLLVHARNTTRFFDIGTRSWSATLYKTVSDNSRTYPFMGGTAVLPLRPSENYRVKVVVAGGADKSAQIAIGDDSQYDNSVPGMTSCEMLDLGDAAPAWKAIAPLNEGRVMCDLVTLPDGKLFIVGGNKTGKADYGRGPTYRPELYDPQTNTWTLLASTRIARGYHATALLLPDGRIAITGKDGDYQGSGLQYAETRVEIFSPPYLFKGPRPAIQSAPASINHGGSFTLGLSSGTSPEDIGSIVIVACGSATHQINFSHRIVELVFAVSGGTLTVNAPPNANIAPPGYYMMFVLSKLGVPSVSSIVHVAAGSAQAASATPEALTRQPRVATVSIEQAGDAPRCAPLTVAEKQSINGMG
ncbi:galactose oxidase-like domain-containing protein [Burkholderia pseudomallei]|uniref:galactose oxidase-like domain-containing protein n=1 Tax=Burkholderia pseudomallei TaxID=28450 RepID=UPI0040640926